MDKNDWNLNSYDYILPKKLIAQYPSPKRDQSRMLLIERKSGKILNKKFSDIVSILPNSSCIVVNNTKVLPVRLNGKRNTGGKVEALLIEEINVGEWTAMLSNSRRIKKGEKIDFCSGELSAFAKNKLDNGQWELKFENSKHLKGRLEKFGLPPLPPYIERNEINDKLNNEDSNRYQTCFASEPGAIAAPTAGLHFTHEIMSKIKKKGIEILEVTLHVGLGTFKPILIQDIRKHKMHSEFFSVSSQTIEKIKYFKENNKKIFSIGTTSMRVLETLGQKNFKTKSGWTDIFIHAPYKFKITDGLLTNFHLPKSTLIILVSAFCGRKFLLNSYKKAIVENYRFFSYGDCMMII
tara:strand:- start:856 stop:1908 length:1053 start_codon:yes stop_codon:yes gene_type:complete